jgi:S-DNA-T family DNA segregation ATPase FtsK/SpoIIIE
VRRTVAEIQDLLNEREGRFAQHGIESMTAYRKMRAAGRFAEDPYGDVFLVVDGWATLRENYDDLEGQITDLTTRGLAYGVHIVAATLRWRDFRPAIADQFGTKLELKLGDSGDSFCRNRKIPPQVPARPGFGVTYEGLFSLALRPEIDVVGSSEELVAQIRKHWTGADAPRVRMLPNVYPYEQMKVTVAAPGSPDEWTMPIGLGDDLSPAYLDFLSEVHLVAFGESESGRSTLLRQIATTITRRYAPEQAKVLIVDPRRALLGAVTTPHLLGYVNTSQQITDYLQAAMAKMAERQPPADVTAAQLRDRSWLAGRAEFFLIIDDYDMVAQMPGNPLGLIADHLFNARDVGLHMVAAVNVNWSRAGFEPGITQLKTAGSPYLLLSADRGASNPMSGPIRLERMPAGRGRLVTRRGVRLIQTAELPAL